MLIESYQVLHHNTRLVDTGPRGRGLQLDKFTHLRILHVSYTNSASPTQAASKVEKSAY